MTSEGCKFEPCVGCEDYFKKIKTLKEEEEKKRKRTKGRGCHSGGGRGKEKEKRGKESPILTVSCTDLYFQDWGN